MVERSASLRTMILGFSNPTLPSRLTPAAIIAPSLCRFAGAPISAGELALPQWHVNLPEAYRQTGVYLRRMLDGPQPNNSGKEAARYGAWPLATARRLGAFAAKQTRGFSSERSPSTNTRSLATRLGRAILACARPTGRTLRSEQPCQSSTTACLQIWSGSCIP